MRSTGDQLELGFDVNVAERESKQTLIMSDLIVRPTVISVFMRNNTGSCDRQMISLAREWDKIRSMGFDVLGLSKDSVGSHMKYQAKHSIGFSLVSDPEHQFAKAAGSLVEKKMYGKAFWGPTRSAYVLDENAALLEICVKVNPDRHGEQILELLKAI
ncbi:MAG: peroxiredoxin [Verrucomicrobia bacterium TMED71]|uniref:peroxiredoxin n=1 Tax=Candidatus Pelagisphaera phototrophica TaxID=2684113 RepID=UPI000B6296D5|nr:redoxin domain-containing protein [Candidatus Pelagisphaera phototrophica]QXD32351.1 redoxin domain-containing protein [Candidatus Pelagisphaera phototrophica]RPF82279.1 MAG: peroxiredoxin [Verrucomicrobia bacterium TMED71]